ncbi:MAG TPA: MFS transporter, partial [Acidimicrobiia bacterium]|nr:MFS transporter [Acidimicrobiia bacterium]
MTTATSIAATPTAASVTTDRTRRLLVLGLCFATIVFDGYDLIVYGSTVPALLDYGPWNLTPQRVGNIGSLALAGMLVGALSIGTVTDRVGRRKVLIGCLTFFSLAMAGCAIAPRVEVFAACRFLAGLGIGGVMPTAVALTVEWAPAGRQHRYNAVMFSGYSVGGIMAALLAVWYLRDWGFRTLYALGAIPLVTVVPLAWRFLPESQPVQEPKGGTTSAVGGGIVPRALFARQRL